MTLTQVPVPACTSRHHTGACGNWKPHPGRAAPHGSWWQPEHRSKQIILWWTKSKISYPHGLSCCNCFCFYYILFLKKKKKLICQILFGILQSLEFCISTFLIAIKIFLRKINEWGLLKVISKFRAVIMVMVLCVYTYLQTPQVVCIKYVQLYAYHTSIK